MKGMKGMVRKCCTKGDSEVVITRLCAVGLTIHIYLLELRGMRVPGRGEEWVGKLTVITVK